MAFMFFFSYLNHAPHLANIQLAAHGIWYTPDIWVLNGPFTEHIVSLIFLYSLVTDLTPWHDSTQVTRFDKWNHFHPFDSILFFLIPFFLIPLITLCISLASSLCFLRISFNRSNSSCRWSLSAVLQAPVCGTVSNQITHVLSRQYKAS